jgi:hypothetical protein
VPADGSKLESRVNAPPRRSSQEHAPVHDDSAIRTRVGSKTLSSPNRPSGEFFRPANGLTERLDLDTGTSCDRGRGRDYAMRAPTSRAAPPWPPPSVVRGMLRSTAPPASHRGSRRLLLLDPSIPRYPLLPSRCQRLGGDTDADIRAIERLSSTRTRFPSSNGTGASSVMVLPWTNPLPVAPLRGK